MMTTVLLTIDTLLLCALVAAVAVLVVRCFRTAAPPPTLERLLAERLGRGTITEQEYERRLRLLTGPPRGNEPGN